jgi:hypothetical protein
VILFAPETVLVALPPVDLDLLTHAIGNRLAHCRL